MPEVSVIIRAKNEEALIGRALEMVAAQTFRDVEIVVVDSGSTDRTLDIARKFTSLIIEIPSEEFTFGYASNTGCGAASGRYGVLLSAHAVPSDEHWLRHLLGPFAEADVAATWGSQHGWSDSVDTLPRSQTKRLSLRKDNFGPHNGVWGFNAANAAIRLDLWRDAPFDEHLPASEDKLWAWNHIKKGYKVVYVPEASAYHSHQLTPWRAYKRAWQEHWAVAEFMPELKFGLWDVAKGVLTRPRRGLWKDADTAVGRSKAIIPYSSYLAYRLICRFMYHWGLYRGLKAGRSQQARQSTTRAERTT